MTTATTLDGSAMVWMTARLATMSTASTYARLEQNRMTSIPIVPSATTACHGLSGTPRPTASGMCAPIAAGSGSRSGNVLPGGTRPLTGDVTHWREASFPQMTTESVPVTSSEHVRVREPRHASWAQCTNHRGSYSTSNGNLLNAVHATATTDIQIQWRRTRKWRVFR